MKMKIVVEGKSYDVEVEIINSEPACYTQENCAAAQAAIVAEAPVLPPVPLEDTVVTDLLNHARVCRSPISGTIVRNGAEAGQEVKKGEVMMVLEAMKMETDIAAPYNGKIRSVNCKAGDSVRGGQVLVEFE
jgi:methylmalonyl-CoA carboxyltransferase small subunit